MILSRVKVLVVSQFEILEGDCLNHMSEMQDNSIDAVVTDPPYGLGEEPDPVEMLRAWVAGESQELAGAGFMGKKWDRFVPQPVVWKEVYRILKPGGHVLSFFGTRTYDWGVMSMRFAGFEIRDMIGWVFGSGFPKSRDISKAIDSEAGVEREVVGQTNVCGMFKQDYQIKQGYRSDNGSDGYAGERNGANITTPKTQNAKKYAGFGTALKPALNPIALARKPISEKTIAANVLRWGVGGLNIDSCRVDVDVNDNNHRINDVNIDMSPSTAFLATLRQPIEKHHGPMTKGRWPANLIHDGSDEVLRVFPECESKWGKSKAPIENKNGNVFQALKRGKQGRDICNQFVGDSGSASRFFYCAKCSKCDRDEGLTGFEAANHHPTVKPTKLMKYLCRLITPPGGRVYDPFAGSGSTGKAAMLEGFKFIGSELDPHFCEIARARIQYAIDYPELIGKPIETIADTDTKQLKLFAGDGNGELSDATKANIIQYAIEAVKGNAVKIKYTDCASCKGTGEIKHEICSFCNGNGEIPKIKTEKNKA